MSTDFFKRFSCALAMLFVAATLVYAACVGSAKAVDVSIAFYFLVSEDTRVEAGAEFIKLDGGAGYLLAEGVALSVYRKKEEGISVQAGLSESGKRTTLIEKEVKKLYFCGMQKRNYKTFLSAIELYDGCISVLDECISRLEKGMTQEACRRILTHLRRQFAQAGKLYRGYSEFAALCKREEENLATFEDGNVYGRDLRYLLCAQAESLLELCDAFTI